MPCLWLDGGLTKACRVLRARLGPLGWGIVCRTSLPDHAIAELARRMGCVVVSTDWLAARHGWVYVPKEYASRKSARDLATHVIKLALRAAGTSPTLFPVTRLPTPHPGGR